MLKRLIFPLINAIVVAMLFGIIGYYLFDLVTWLLIGFAGGLLVGLVFEFGTKPINEWLYRRRITLTVLLEIPLIVFFIGPYGYVLGLMRPMQTEISGQSPADFGADYADVRIPVADGETLAGWFIAPTPPNDAVIMILHGGSANRTGSMWHAAQLYEVGYGLLLYDQRALGESTGTTQSAGWYDARDVPHLIDWLSEQPGVNPERIGGVGLSLGGQILLIAGPDEPRLKAILADGVGIGSLEDLPEQSGLREQFTLLMNRQVYAAMQFHLQTTPPPPFIEQIPRSAPRPLLLIVGGADEFEREVNARYADLLGENAEQWVIDGAPHGGGPAVNPDEYVERMLAFFEAALLEADA